MLYVKINNTLYPASISGKIHDSAWDNRESKSITLEGDYATINALFPDGVAWSIVDEHTKPVLDELGNPVLDENGEPTYETTQTEFDNSEFNIRGSLTVNTNGTCTVKMGKATELENALAALNDAVSASELDAAYQEGVQNA